MSRTSTRESFAIATGDPSNASQKAGWVERIRTGDPAAFEALFHAYHAPLCASVLRRSWASLDGACGATQIA
jgi:hypothetical protein